MRNMMEKPRETGKNSFDLLHDKEYFEDKRNNTEFKERLLNKLENDC
jgi:hypothetical protein